MDAQLFVHTPKQIDSDLQSCPADEPVPPDFMERHKNEQTFEQPGMWQAEALAHNPYAFDVQKVDVDFARPPA